MVVVLKAKFSSSNSGESLRSSLFHFINMYFDRTLLVYWYWWKLIVFNSTSFIWEQQGAFTWKIAVSVLMSIGWSFCHKCYINQRLSSTLLPCLSPPTKVDKAVIYGYPTTIHSFHLYLSRVGSTVYVLNASRLAGIQSRQITDLSCHLALNRTSMGHWTKSSRSQIQHLKIGWHFLSIHNLGGVTILKTFKLTQNLALWYPQLRPRAMYI